MRNFACGRTDGGGLFTGANEMIYARRQARAFSRRLGRSRSSKIRGIIAEAGVLGWGGIRAKTSLEILQLVQVDTTQNKSCLLLGKFNGIFLKIASAKLHVPILS